MTAADTIMVGGMLRCCVRTIKEHPTPGREGEILQCQDIRKCGAQMKFYGGAWHWWPR